MSKLAIITGTSSASTSRLTGALVKRIDNMDITGFRDIPSYLSSYQRSEVYDKVLMIDKAVSDTPSNDFGQLKEFLTKNSSSTDLIYAILPNTSQNNVVEFNKTFTSQKAAVCKLATDANGAVTVKDMVAVCEADPSDIIKDLPDYNHKILSEEVPQESDSMALGINLPYGSETGILDEDGELPPDESDELPPDESDLPPDDTDPVDEDAIKQILDSINITMPKVHTGTFMVTSLHDEDAASAAVGIGLRSVLEGNKTLIFDLTREHLGIRIFRDEPEYANYQLGIDKTPYQSTGLYCLSADTVDKSVIRQAITRDISEFKTVIYLLDVDNIRYFPYSKEAGVSCCVVLHVEDNENLINLFSSAKVAPNAFASAYEMNGHSLYVDGIATPPDYFIDRVNWFRD